MADILDETFHIIQAALRPEGNLPQSSVSVCDTWTDTEVVERCKTAPGLPDAAFICPFGPCAGRLAILCNDTVVKIVWSWVGFHPERLALEFIRSHTTIPVPYVRRYIESKGKGYILMEKIEGTRLDKVWPSLSVSQRFFVALTLRDYIRQLHQASMHHPRRHIPGPLGLGDAPQLCGGCTWLWGNDDLVGPYASSAEFVECLNRDYKLPKDPKDKDTYIFQARGTFSDSHPLVLTHMDLSLRNIILGRDGRLWLVDFEWSGFYPPWFEHLATMAAADNDSHVKNSWMNKPGAQDAARSWWRYIPFVTGSWQREANLHNYGNSSLKLQEAKAGHKKEDTDD